jgi:hypothetical protein
MNKNMNFKIETIGDIKDKYLPLLNKYICDVENDRVEKYEYKKFDVKLRDYIETRNFTYGDVNMDEFYIKITIDGKYIFLVNKYGSHIKIIKTHTGELIKNIDFCMFHLSLDCKHVTIFHGDKLSTHNIDTWTLIKESKLIIGDNYLSYPYCFSSDGKALVYTVYLSNNVAQIRIIDDIYLDGKNSRPVYTFKETKCNPLLCEISPDKSKLLFVNDHGDDRSYSKLDEFFVLKMVCLNTNRLISKKLFLNRPSHLGFSFSGNMFYLACGNVTNNDILGSLSINDCKTKFPITEKYGYPQGCSFTINDKIIYALSYGDKYIKKSNIVIFDPDENIIKKQVHLDSAESVECIATNYDASIIVAIIGTVSEEYAIPIRTYALRIYFTAGQLYDLPEQPINIEI